MIPRVATVLSARPWEADLVTAAQKSAQLKMVLRAYQPGEILDRAGEIDVVVAGAETSWLTAGVVGRWKRAGLKVIGTYPPGDSPARRMLYEGGADELVADDCDTQDLIKLIRFLPVGGERSTPEPTGHLVAVAGARGAPGRTEVAVALAISWARNHRALLIDLDVAAPSIAMRLNLKPRPSLIEAIEGSHAGGLIEPELVQRFGRLAVIVGSRRLDDPVLRPDLVDSLLDAALAGYDVVVADLGCGGETDAQVLKRSHDAVLVVEASTAGVVRAADLIAEWAGPAPALVVNRAGSDKAAAVDAVRTWTGLEPATVIPERTAVRTAGRAGRVPDRRFLRSLRSLRVPN